MPVALYFSQPIEASEGEKNSKVKKPLSPFFHSHSSSLKIATPAHKDQKLFPPKKKKQLQERFLMEKETIKQPHYLPSFY